MDGVKPHPTAYRFAVTTSGPDMCGWVKPHPTAYPLAVTTSDPDLCGWGETPSYGVPFRPRRIASAHVGWGSTPSRTAPSNAPPSRTAKSRATPSRSPNPSAVTTSAHSASTRPARMSRWIEECGQSAARATKPCRTGLPQQYRMCTARSLSSRITCSQNRRCQMPASFFAIFDGDLRTGLPPNRPS